MCVACPEGSYFNGSKGTACFSCPENSTTLFTGSLSQTECICSPGYSGPDEGPCFACQAGTHKATKGSAGCEVCETSRDGIECMEGVPQCNNGQALPFGDVWVPVRYTRGRFHPANGMPPAVLRNRCSIVLIDMSHGAIRQPRWHSCLLCRQLVVYPLR